MSPNDNPETDGPGGDPQIPVNGRDAQPEPNPKNAEVPGSSLKSRTIRATVLSLLSQGSAQILRLLSNVVLTRLLFPEAFGLMALVRMLLHGLHMISDVGIGPSIIQHARGDQPAFLNTAWTLQALRGVAVWLVSAAIAAPFADFYDEPELRILIPVALLAAVIGGLASTKLATLNRRIALGRIVFIELFSQVLAIAVMIGHAWVFHSVWSLVSGALVQGASKALLSHLAVPGPRNRFAWDKEAARDIFSFGKWIFVSSLITFLAMRFDVLVLGRLVPMGELGIYSIALTLGAVPNQVSDKLAALVLFPALSASYREDPALLGKSFRRARRTLLPLGALTFLGGALIAPAFFTLLYDPRYHDAGWMAQLAMLQVWFTFLHETSSRALLAVGDSRSLATSNLAKLLVSSVACIGGYFLYGIVGCILGTAVGALAGYAVVVLALRKNGLPTARHDALYTLVGVVIALGVTFAASTVAPLLGLESPLWPGLGLAALVLTPLLAMAALRVRGEIRG